MATLPKELDYTSKLQALPSSTHTISCVVSPVNGTTFAAGGEIIQIDLPSRGYLVPGSMYIKYKHTLTQDATATTLLGTPVYTPFARSEVIMGASVVESIQDYNQVCNMLVNTKLNYAQKVGVAAAFGYLNATTLPTYANMNGASVVASATNVWNLAAPLGNILSNCENLFPLALAPAVRIQLTTEALANLTQSGTSTASVLSNVELCFDIVEFGPEVDAVVRSMSDANGNLIIKSQSYSSSTLALPAGSSGSLELTYNQRISSIKSVFALFTSTTGSKKFGSCDITKNVGDYQFFIGSIALPQRPLSATNKGAMLMELAQAVSGNAHSIDATNMSITPYEYFIIDGDGDTGVQSSKFYVSTNTERLSSNSAILTGISSQLSPISLRVNLPVATTDAHNSTLVLCYDALIELNVMTRQASVKS